MRGCGRRARSRRWIASFAGIALLGSGLATTPARAAAEPVDPAAEAANYAKQLERGRTYLTPDGVVRLAQTGVINGADALLTHAADPGRLFLTNLCAWGALACAGDTRLGNWVTDGHGLAEPVLFTGRSGATISGRVWATRSGPAKRPGIVITSGSVQANERMYWWAAQALAKAGYVVITTDPQGQGRSDVLGAERDALDDVPSQFTGHTFFDGTQDALDFLLSTPDAPYCPAPSRSGDDHCDKQRHERNTDHNPFWNLLDPQRIGLAGHSYGAQGVSWIGQQDPRVDAVVAWDNLCDPRLPTHSLADPRELLGMIGQSGFEDGCAEGGNGEITSLTKPALGISNDYFLTPAPFTTRPDPMARASASKRYSEAGVDTGQLVIRGGTHFEYSYAPMPPLGATLRGIDLAAWYTTAWFDKYVKQDPSADARLLSTRWQNDAPGAAVDPNRDGNLFSYHFRSRMDVRLSDGSRFNCENLRAGCSGMTPDDGHPGYYGYLPINTSPDS